MENRTKEIKAKVDGKIKIKVVQGHFATNHSHINYYVDLTDVKVQHTMAKRAAAELARKYQTTSIDTIICLEGTEMLGAFLADELSQPGHMSMNGSVSINVLTPELNSNNQMIFRDNTQKMIEGQSVLLLVASASTGKTVNRALDCLQYYGGLLTGICAVFSAAREMNGVEIASVFTEQDISGYKTFVPAECEMCKAKERIDAIVNSFGYSKL